jgi:hypothetical protein
MPFLFLALAIAAALGGGISWEASNALPGDALYPFKISVNESVEAALAQSDAAKADLDISLAQERLDEAQQLAKENKLTSTIQSQLTQNFDARAQSVSAFITTLEHQNNYQTASALATNLQTMLTSEVSILQDASSQGSVARQVSLVPILVEARKTLAATSVTTVALSAKAVAENETGL